MVKQMVWIAVVRSLVQRGLEALLATTAGMWIANLLVEAGLPFSVEAISGTLSIFIFGLIVYAVNKWGPRFAIINKIFSLGLSRTGPAYVPNDSDTVTTVAVVGGPDRTTTVDTPPPGPNE